METIVQLGNEILNWIITALAAMSIPMIISNIITIAKCNPFVMIKRADKAVNSAITKAGITKMATDIVTKENKELRAENAELKERLSKQENITEKILKALSSMRTLSLEAREELKEFFTPIKIELKPIVKEEVKEPEILLR